MMVLLVPWVVLKNRGWLACLCTLNSKRISFLKVGKFEGIRQCSLPLLMAYFLASMEYFQFLKKFLMDEPLIE